MNKFRKQLKKIGMESEFQNWMKDIKTISTEFKVGNRVEVIEHGIGFGLPKGCKGTIKEVYQSYMSEQKTIGVVFDEQKDDPYTFYTSRFKLIK